jgi:hypothetical protein
MTEQLRLSFRDLWVLVLPEGPADENGVCDLVTHRGRPIYDKQTPHFYVPLFTAEGLANAFLQRLKTGTPGAARGRLPNARAFRDFMILVKKEGIDHVAINPLFEENRKLVWPINAVIEMVQTAGFKAMKPEFKFLGAPVSPGHELRIAPSRDGTPAAHFWKFRVSGNEVYATNRILGNTAKISVHASGQIHMRIEKRDLQRLAPPLLLGNGQWLHAFELRFLLSTDASLPPIEKLKCKRAFLIDVPPETVLILNLLIGQAGYSATTELPHEFLPAAQPVWRDTLKDQRPVVLIGRVMLMDKQNIDEIKFIRHELNPKVNLSAPQPVPPYVEIRRVVWSPEGGNVVLVVPMGTEAFRVHDESTCDPSAASTAPPRTVKLASPSTSIPIAAPNGAIVGTVSIAGANNEVALKKNVEVRGCLGTVALSINPSSLIFGESFGTPSTLCTCVPTVDGARPRNWDYRVVASFDGTTLTVEIRQVSIGFRNANLTAPMPALGPTEELIMAAPIGGLVLRSTATAPQSSAGLEASFLLRDV